MAIDMDTQNDALGKGWKRYPYVLSKVAVEYPGLRCETDCITGVAQVPAC